METFAERIRRMGGKGYVKEAFRMFGEHCARNQVCPCGSDQLSDDKKKLIQLRSGPY
jgi:hypothetical protein